MFEEMLKRKKLDVNKLTSFGFNKNELCYRFSCIILDGLFNLEIDVFPNGNINSKVIEIDSDEEYILYKTNAIGSFVGEVRTAVDKVVSDIVENCYYTEVFQSEQAKMAIEYVRSKYNDELEFLWTKFPDNVVWRRKDNKKWYGAILTITKDKLGFSSTETVEIIDLRILTEDLEHLLSKENYYSGWHMNKKHWYTMILDNSISDDEICRRIDNSYQLAV
ncbi:MAG: MmcQ/YjbR family DNA-binding protein [Anaerostipes sp.]|nr:MmcQ/YjbR family DNA-binding protein [Anaerostipes sp.]